MLPSNGDILVYDGVQWVNQQSSPGPMPIDSPTFYVDNTNHRVGLGTTSPNSKLHVAGAIATAVTTVSTTPYSIAAGDSVILVDNSSQAITLNLPAAGTIVGRRYTIIPLSANYTVTLSASPRTIDGSTSISVPGAVTVISNGYNSNWDILPCN